MLTLFLSFLHGIKVLFLVAAEMRAFSASLDWLLELRDDLDLRDLPAPENRLALVPLLVTCLVFILQHLYVYQFQLQLQLQ